MSRTIVIANQKGGVGKTTTVANLGVALTELGKRVLLIDLDPQAALTATFGYDPYNLQGTMYSMLMHDSSSLARILKPAGKSGKMALAPASVDLAAAEVKLTTEDNRAHRLKEALRRNRIPFDFILIDTPPSLGVLTLNGLVGSNEVLIPVQCHFLAMRGVRPLMETVWRVKRRLNPQLQLLGLLPTMYNANNDHTEDVVGELENVFEGKVFEVVIKQAIEFAEAPVANQTLVEFNPYHEGAAAYRRLAEVIVNGSQ